MSRPTEELLAEEAASWLKVEEAANAALMEKNLDAELRRRGTKGRDDAAWRTTFGDDEE